MDGYFGLIVIFFVIVSSILQKLQERKAMRNAQEQKKHARPEDLPEETRRMLYGPSGKPQQGREQSDEPHVREARPKTARPAQPQSDPAKQLLESLFGVQVETEVEEEGDWAPVQPKERKDTSRRAAERQPARQQQRPQRQQQPRHVREHAQQQREQARQTAPPQVPPIRHPQQAQAKRQESREEHQRRAVAERERRKQQRAAAQRQQQPQRQSVRRVAPQPNHRDRLFSELRDVQKAVVFAEVLGKPRALEDEIAAWK